MNGSSFKCCAIFIIYILFIETSEGYPRRSLSLDPAYWIERGQILNEESHDSIGGNLPFRNGERAANVVLMTAKEAEIDDGFKDPSNFLPARNFLTCSDDIERSETFRIIRDMPKGAALHVHDSAITSSKFVYQNITFRDNLYVCLPQNGSIYFKFLREAGKDATCDWKLLADLRANASVANDVENLVKRSLTMVVKDPAKSYPDGNAAWRTFGQMFVTVNSMISYYPVHEDFFYQGLTEMYNDNVLYIELRTTLVPLYDLDGKIYDRIETARLYKRVADRFVKEHPDFIGLKLIFSHGRRLSEDALSDYLTLTKKLMKEFSKFVIGFDLVGQEDKGDPLTRFADELRAISPDIKLFLHAGETNWNGLSTDENLIDAVLLNTTRIGHGYALLKHPKILELAKQREIAIEVNPISNQVLKLVDDMRNHPASFLFAKNYPVVVSSDDPGLWGAVGLSYDFYEAFVGIMSRSADIRALKQLAINSIKYSAMTRDEKIYAYKIWKYKWQIFVINLVQVTTVEKH